MNNAHFVDVLFVIASLFLLMSTSCSSQIEGVVVCNKTHCDFVPTPPKKILSDEALVYTSSASGNRFTLTRIKRRAAGFIEPELDEKDAKRANIKVDLSERHQEIIGFGGGITDSAAQNILALSAETRSNLMRSYFGQSGIDYTIARVPMTGTDFSPRSYSHCDSDSDDFELTRFRLQPEDLELKIPTIKEASKLTDGKLKLYASPWSAPGWMKETGKMNGGGPLKGDVDGPYYKAWSKYFVRFFEEYAKKGVNFWGVTVENEPYFGQDLGILYPAMYLSAEMQRDFIKNVLGPTLANNSVTSSLKLMVYDDNRDHLFDYANMILNDPEAEKYVSGMAVHWYSWWLGPENLERTSKTFPDKFLLATEACNAWNPAFPEYWDRRGPHLGNWTYGEYYGENIMEDLQNGVSGWTDWNICLNESGGPSFVPSVATDAPIIVNAEADEFYKQPMYYMIGHFSKFIRPGAVRVGVHFSSPEKDMKTSVEFNRIVRKTHEAPINESESELAQQLLHKPAIGFQSGIEPSPSAAFAKAQLMGVATIEPESGRVVIVLLNTFTDKDYNVLLALKSSEADNFMTVYVERNSIVSVLLDL